MQTISDKLRQEWEQTKLSQCSGENVHFIRYFSNHIRSSVNLRVLQLCGFKFSKVGYKLLGQGIEDSMVLKRFVI